MRYNILLAILLFIFAKTGIAQQIETVKNPKLPYHFLVHYPEGYKDNPKKKYPLILSLHGRSLQGNDVEKVKSYGVIYETLRGLKIDFIVVAPQCQSGWDNAKLIQILDYAESTYQVDKSRVYLTGMSMGGYGAWHLAGAYPTRFAAVAPVCGGGKVSDAENLKALPHWVFHGAKDIPVPITESEKMVKAIRAAGNKQVEFTVYKDWGHSELAVVFSKKELYSWFLKYKKGDEFIEPDLPEEPIIATIDTKKPDTKELTPKVLTPVTPKPLPTPKEKEPEFIVFDEPRSKEQDDVEKDKKPEKTPVKKPTKPAAKKAKWWEVGKWKIWQTLK